MGGTTYEQVGMGFIRKQTEVGKLSQRLGALAALTEVPSSILSTHMAAYNHLLTPDPGDLVTFPGFCELQVCINIHAGKHDTCNIKRNN